MANEWNKTAFVEFETMLRRHLRTGAAPVAACAGFDLDAASAYLESALGGSRRAAYESHLAGCAVCRRHLIELARLAQAAPRAEAQPVTVMDQAPAWVRWREVVAGRFNFSAWNLKWQIAGATGAAFAILIAVLGVQSWRQMSARVDRASAPPPVDELAVQPLPSPTPEPSPQNAATPIAQDLGLNRQGPAQVPAPALPVGPIGNAKDIPVEAASGALAVSSNQLAEAPATAKPSSVEAGQSPPPQLRPFAERGSLPEVSRPGLSDPRKDSRGPAAKESVQGPRDIPRYRAALVGDKPEPTSKSQPNKPLTRQAVEAAREMIKRSFSPFGKLSLNSESERKDTPDTQESKDDESSKPLVWRVRDKVFLFDKGMWIDQEYRSEMQEWRLWPLTRDSEAYKQVLADEPLLKEFFDHGPILIVWKNRIYKVLKQEKPER
jgi:hypothetical protein